MATALWATSAWACNVSDLQAELDKGGRVEISGTCNVNDTLRITQPTTLDGPGVIVSKAPIAISIEARNVTLRNLIIWNDGVGVNVNGGRVFLRDLQINTGSDGIRLTKGAGAWMSGLHFNGTPGHRSYAIKILQWDTAYVSDTLSEQHDGGFRIGGQDVVGNIYLSSVVLDRLGLIGMLIEPNGGHVANIQASNLWMSGPAPYSMILNATDGPISNTQIVNGRFTSLENRILEFGTPIRTQTLNMIYD